MMGSTEKLSYERGIVGRLRVNNADNASLRTFGAQAVKQQRRPSRLRRSGREIEASTNKELVLLTVLLYCFAKLSC